MKEQKKGALAGGNNFGDKHVVGGGRRRGMCTRPLGGSQRQKGVGFGVRVRKGIDGRREKGGVGGSRGGGGRSVAE